MSRNITMWATLVGEKTATGGDVSEHLNALVEVNVPPNCVVLDSDTQRAASAFERVRTVIKERVERAFAKEIGSAEVIVSDETVHAVIAAYVG